MVVQTCNPSAGVAEVAGLMDSLTSLHGLLGEFHANETLYLIKQG